MWICPWPNGHLQATRPRRTRPQAVPLPRALARSDAARTSSSGCSRSPTALPRIRTRCDADLARPRPAAREGPGRGRAAARADADPRGQRRVRAAQPVVRADDAARSARPDRGLERALPVPRQVRAARTRSGFATGASPASSAAARSCPARSCSSTSTRTARSATSTSDDVNDYIREASGGDFTAKDFRTWAGTVLAYRALRALQPGVGERAAQAERRGGDPADRRPARQHAGRRPRELRPPGSPRGLPGRIDPRGAGRGRRRAGDPADERDAARGGGGPGAPPPAARGRRRAGWARRGRRSRRSGRARSSGQAADS